MAKDWPMKGIGGGIPGSGRKRKSKQEILKNYEKIMKKLDSAAVDAADFFINGIKATNEDGTPDNWMRLQCSREILDRVVPKKKSTETNIKINKKVKIEDRRAEVQNIISQLDNLSTTELGLNENTGIFEAFTGAKEEAQRIISQEEKT
jgi:hypothetical protein